MSTFFVLVLIVLSVNNVLSLECYRCAQQYTDDDQRIANDNGDCLEQYSCDDTDLFDNGLIKHVTLVSTTEKTLVSCRLKRDVLDKATTNSLIKIARPTLRLRK
ncbi:uncharacterized protein LOC100371666 [Saccoglossus kowalevskii]|uniref:Uncharacterized protein LOC100371666 n=1 Tax=Saccoglossus kowalevskii TaxID=10224 RepID=A0ABM0GNF0_SACKO|nr:PREDICTED: uncharacterized protein LOC100371666 [Saccoglossus kowalevskii]